MRKSIIVGAMALALTANSLAPVALAQPRPYEPSRDQPRGGYDQGRDGQYQRRPPPPGWGESQWERRQRYEQRNRSRRDDHSDAIIAGAIGFALGAAIYGSERERDTIRPRLHDRRWLNWCARRYRSFDRRSGTYLGYDGFRHYCPYSSRRRY